MNWRRIGLAAIYAIIALFMIALFVAVLIAASGHAGS